MKKVITVLVDNDSWILPFAKILVHELNNKGFEVKLVRSHAEVKSSWINFMLGCMKVTPNNVLDKSQHNLVVHESNLPEGRGFSPMSWQILEKKTEIPICLIEASEKVDAGDVWIRDVIKLDGKEISPEWRRKQGLKTIELCLRFVNDYSKLKPIRQNGKSTFYRLRKTQDSELDVEKSISQQFDLLRIVDNDSYPAFFYHANTKYKIKIYRD